MDKAQLEALNERIERVEQDLLERLDALEKANGKSWLSRNFGLILSTLTILATLAAAWGRIETTLDHLTLTDARIQMELDAAAKSVVDHHQNVNVHTDRAWRGEVKDELNNIRDLLIQHMATNGRAAPRSSNRSVN